MLLRLFIILFICLPITGFCQLSGAKGIVFHDTSLSAIEGALVELVKGNHTIAKTTTNHDGYFWFKKVPAGNELRLHVTYNNRVQPFAGLNLEAGKDVYLAVRFPGVGCFGTPDASLMGVITAVDGSVMQGVTVESTGEDGTIRKVTSNHDGYYNVPVSQFGPQILKFYRTDTLVATNVRVYCNSIIEAGIVFRGKKTDTLDMRTISEQYKFLPKPIDSPWKYYNSPAGNLSGRVISDKTHMPLHGAAVRLAKSMARITDSNGRFNMQPVPAGLYDIIISHKGYWPKKFPGVLISGNKPGEMEILLNYDPSGMVPENYPPPPPEPEYSEGPRSNCIFPPPLHYNKDQN